MLEAVQDIVRLVGAPLLTLDQLAQAFERFRAVLDDSAKRRKERSAITAGEDFDEEEAEALEVSCHCPLSCYPLELFWKSSLKLQGRGVTHDLSCPDVPMGQRHAMLWTHVRCRLPFLMRC